MFSHTTNEFLEYLAVFLFVVTSLSAAIAINILLWNYILGV